MREIKIRVNFTFQEEKFYLGVDKDIEYLFLLEGGSENYRLIGAIQISQISEVILWRRKDFPVLIVKGDENIGLFINMDPQFFSQVRKAMVNIKRESNVNFNILIEDWKKDLNYILTSISKPEEIFHKEYTEKATLSDEVVLVPLSTKEPTVQVTKGIFTRLKDWWNKTKEIKAQEVTQLKPYYKTKTFISIIIAAVVVAIIYSILPYKLQIHIIFRFGLLFPAYLFLLIFILPVAVSIGVAYLVCAVICLAGYPIIKRLSPLSPDFTAVLITLLLIGGYVGIKTLRLIRDGFLTPLFNFLDRIFFGN